MPKTVLITGTMKRYLGSVLFILSIVTFGAAHAQEVDVALVNLLSGRATFTARSGTSGEVKPFMKLRDGDRITVAAGGQVRIAFFESSRQELWTGPATFTASKAGAGLIAGKAPGITQLPAGVTLRMTRIPELVKIAKLGGMQVRGLSKHQTQAGTDRQTALAQARSAYETMRQEMPANDIAPELYLYAALYDFRLYRDMKLVVAEMLRKQPGNPDVEALDAWLTARMSH
ncbi:MAG: hypothetical protein IH604_20410 [Burkholderiales bacterium]|nr:hypothetical protein [Burkholderiales bacterium]